ncbi:MAG: HAD family hydrolase [Flavobacteriaceae bacterium]
MENIKLICSDIDGTLLNKERQLSVKTIQEIKRLNRIPFILISSRMPKAMRHLQEELAIQKLPLIAYNGGLIINNAKIISSTEVDLNSTNIIAEFCKSTNIHLSLYHNDEWYVPQLDYWANREANNTKVNPTVQSISKTISIWENENKGAHKIMCMGDENEIDSLVSFIEEELNDAIIAYRSKATYLEIASKKISKKTAIEDLIKFKYATLSLKNVLAFGDNYNDIEMITHVGVGVAVKNAKLELKEKANFITESNLNDGVANFLEVNF